MNELETGEKEPLVTIVTSCLNGQEHGMLHEYFGGVLSQTYENIQLIFVNDGSTDNTEGVYFQYEPKLEEKFHECMYIKFEENKGYITAINTAMEYAEGKYICPFDSDDIMLPHKTRSHVDFLEENEDYAMVYSDGYVVKKGNLQEPVRRLIGEEEPPTGSDLYEGILLGNAQIPGGTYCFRKECWKKIKPLENKFERRGQNVQIFTTIAFHYKIGYNDVSPVMKYVIREDSLSQRMTLDNLYFKSFTREDLDRYIMDQYGASKSTKRELDIKYNKRKFLYYFVAEEEENLKDVFSELLNARETETSDSIPIWIIFVFSILLTLSFLKPLQKIILKAMKKFSLIKPLYSII